MKRIAIVLACLLVIPLLAGPTSAAAKGVRLYRAETSDGQSLRFRVVRDERGRRLGGVFFGQDFQLPCDDGTTVSLGGGFRSPQWFFEGRTVTVDLWNDQDIIAMHIVGTFGPATASGTFRYTLVLLNEDETTRLCSTGDLTWTAERLYPDSWHVHLSADDQPMNLGTGGGNVKRIAIVLAGLLVIPLLAGPASAADKASRRYRAETSDGQTLRLGTVRDEDGRRRLNSVFFGEGFQLPCDDGTTLPYSGAGFSGWPWYFEGRTVTVDEWHDHDNFTLHLLGTFRPATASGTFRYTVAFLNEDETARRCSTGDLTWTAERIYWTPGTST